MSPVEFPGISREFGGFVIFGNHDFDRRHTALPDERIGSHTWFRSFRFRLVLVVRLDELTQRGDSPVKVVPCGAGFQHYA